MPAAAAWPAAATSSCAGGTLVYEAGSFAGGTLIAGSAASAAGSMARPAARIGAGVLVEGDTTITFAPGAGQTVSPPIRSPTWPSRRQRGGRVAGRRRRHRAAGGGGRIYRRRRHRRRRHAAPGRHGAAGTGHIRFAAGATLEIEAGVAVTNTLDGIQQGAVIDVAGITGATAVVNAGTLTIAGTGGSIDLRLGSLSLQQAFAAVDDGAGGTAVTYTACYAAGTRIATPEGEAAVETLRAGDLVRLAAGGVAAVRWMGHRRVDCARHPRPLDVAPVRVRAHAFAPGQPHRDLVLSPDHAVFVEGDAEGGAPGVLIPIRYLVNGATVVQEAAGEIEYWHVELPAHGVILAEGLAAESYLDTGNRAAFANGGAVAMAHPDFALKVWAAASCARLVTAGPVRDSVAARLLARAALLGHATTGDAAPVLVLGRHALRPRRHGAGWRWRLPARAEAGVLMSRSFVPAQMGTNSDDHRRLGIPVARIMLDDAELALDGLGTGWRPAEPGLRWTDGAATIPLAGARTLTVLPAMAAQYWDDAPAPRRVEG